jgi:large repetitive protein
MRARSVAALSIAFVLGSSTAVASEIHYKNLITATHPIAYWRLGETSGSVAHAVVGQHPGAYKGAPELGRSGLIQRNANKAPHFDGIDDRVKDNSFTDRPQASWSRGYTLEAWVVTRTRTAEEHIIAFNHNNGANSIALFRDEPTNRFKFHDCEGNGCVAVYSKTRPVIGRTYQVVVTVNAANHGRLYVNGRSQARFVSAKRPVHAGRFTIGAEYDLGPQPSSYWHGKIDEVVIYNRAISARRVATQWSAGT